MAKRNPVGPQFVRWFGPLINALEELGGSGRPQEVMDRIALDLKLPDNVRSDLLPSGNSRFDNQVYWARFYLAKAGLIDASRGKVWALTDAGRHQIGLPQAKALDIFQEVHAKFVRSQPKDKGCEVPAEDTQTAPISDDSSVGYREKLAAVLKSLPPSGFERLCQRLLRESGFEQVVVTGQSGDGGIDGHGVLQVNPFVSFKVVFQCKRYSGAVTPSQVRDFRGSMDGRADKGIIITTGSFTTEAHSEALRPGAQPIETVNGEKLLELFEALELGLIPKKTFELDENFFDEYRK